MNVVRNLSNPQGQPSAGRLWPVKTYDEAQTKITELVETAVEDGFVEDEKVRAKAEENHVELRYLRHKDGRTMTIELLAQ